MDSDEEDSAEEDDEGVNPASTESGIFDVEDSGFEGLTAHSQTYVMEKSKLSPNDSFMREVRVNRLVGDLPIWHGHPDLGPTDLVE